MMVWLSTVVVPSVPSYVVWCLRFCSTVHRKKKKGDKEKDRDSLEQQKMIALERAQMSINRLAGYVQLFCLELASHDVRSTLALCACVL